MRAPCLSLLVLSLLSACRGPLWTADDGTAVSALDPLLVENAGSFVFSFSTTRACADIVDLGPAELAVIVESEDAPMQVVFPSSPVGITHVFGSVPPSTALAFFTLVSARQETDVGDGDGLEAFVGSMTGVGCRDFAAASGVRRDVPLTIFPAGLR